MTDFNLYDETNAPEAARPVLATAKSAFGFVPNLLGTLSESPAAAEAYLTLAGIVDKTSLSPAERQIVLLSVSYENTCHYCMAAHSVSAEMQKVPQDVVDAIRNDDSIANVKLEALRKFTIQVVDKRGWVSHEDIQAFVDVGYTSQQILEVILGVSFKMLSNYVNHITDTPLDAAFAKKEWVSPASK